MIDTELLIWPELRCLMLLEGAFVGVIVTDGVIVRLDPVRVSPIGSRWPGLLGVKVAPPGSEGCLTGGLVTGVIFMGDPRLTGGVVTDLEDFEWAGNGRALVGVTLSEPFVKAVGIAANGLFMLVLVGVTTIFSFIITC